MRYQVVYRCVPVGLVELPITELSVGELHFEQGYDTIRTLILEASRSLWAAGFFKDVTPGALSAPAEVIRRAAELELELHTEQGESASTDFINIVERPTGGPPIVFVRFRLSQAASPAREALPPLTDAWGNRPDR